MKFRAFHYNYHEADMVAFASHHNAIIIDTVLNPCFNTAEQSVRVVLGGVDNAGEVAAFFGSLPKPETPGTAIAEISALQYTGTGPNWVHVSLTPRMISVPRDIVIRASQVYES